MACPDNSDLIVLGEWVVFDESGEPIAIIPYDEEIALTTPMKEE